ncbi:uncharacterized protein LOC124491751 [Dermatophagoides farinae]|uniref:Uncharacterized protein n=1 Tax=Dermatophagoides farinae TaxID=6954 RepID=A0A922LCV2_DERFA|nr:hypothetical protein DERF_001153 [Dermatophagoides farinae]
MPDNRSSSSINELMAQADAMRMIQPEGSYEWFDDMIPKAKKLLQQIQREQAIYGNGDGDGMTTKLFNKVRDCCDTFDNWIRQLQRIRDDLEKQKGNILKSEMNRLSIHNGAYGAFRGFLGK